MFQHPGQIRTGRSRRGATVEMPDEATKPVRRFVNCCSTTSKLDCGVHRGVNAPATFMQSLRDGANGTQDRVDAWARGTEGSGAWWSGPSGTVVECPLRHAEISEGLPRDAGCILPQAGSVFFPKLAGRGTMVEQCWLSQRSC